MLKTRCAAKGGFILEKVKARQPQAREGPRRSGPADRSGALPRDPCAYRSQDGSAGLDSASAPATSASSTRYEMTLVVLVVKMGTGAMCTGERPPGSTVPRSRSV
jgi:hypothetical protein